MLRRRALLFVSLVAAAPTGPCRAESALATAAVDYSLYREGEVRRSESHYGGWLLTCDVIRRLGEKFCSLRAVARPRTGRSSPP